MDRVLYNTAETLRIFESEVAPCEGTVGNNYRDEHRVFARSVLPIALDVRPQDAVNAGVALRQIETQVVVYPFIFRQVCKNGQVMAHGSNQRATKIEISDGYTAEIEIREAVQACLAPEVFPAVVQEVRKSVKDTRDFLVSTLPHIRRKLEASHPRLTDRILKRFLRKEPQSRFGLMNAVTAVARDTDDPQVRWDLEQLGGAIGAGLPVEPPELPARAKAPSERRRRRKKLRREGAKERKSDSRVKV